MPDQSRAAIALFDPKRLTLAREARGLLKSELAERVDISKAAVGDFELGKKRPSPATVRQLALVLDVPVAFFADIRGRKPEQPAAYFRSLRSTRVKEQRAARAAAAFAHELIVALESRVQLPKLDVPSFRLGPEPSDSDIEQVAARTRAALEAADGPLGMLIRRIERLGVVIVRLPVESTKIDAFSVPYSDRPIMVLGSDTTSYDRYRWNAAHELGHLVMHGQLASEPDRAQEKQADRFAAALLMPIIDIRFALPRTIDWTRLLALKRDWGVSIAALIERAHQLGLLSDVQRTKAFKEMSARKWRKNEPVDLGPPELPSLLRLAVHAAMEADKTDERGVAELARLSPNDIRFLLRGVTDERPVISLDWERESRISSASYGHEAGTISKETKRYEANIRPEISARPSLQAVPSD